MPVITYVAVGGDEREVEVEPGVSVMRAALQQGVRGIVGECGGQAMCATCHVYVDDADAASALPERSDDEEEMLDCTAAERFDDSRLGCQLRAGEHFERLRVRLPETQV